MQPENSKPQNCDTNRVPHWVSHNITYRRIKLSRHGDLACRIVHPSSVILLRFCTSYEDHNLLEYDAVNFSTCVGRLYEN